MLMVSKLRGGSRLLNWVSNVSVIGAILVILTASGQRRLIVISVIIGELRLDS